MSHKERAKKASVEMLKTAFEHPETPFAALSDDCQLLLCVLADYESVGADPDPVEAFEQFSQLLTINGGDAAKAVKSAPQEIIDGLSGGDAYLPAFRLN